MHSAAQPGTVPLTQQDVDNTSPPGKEGQTSIKTFNTPRELDCNKANKM